jgi:hypothetical protein
MTQNAACIEQIGGPQPPNLWSRTILNCVDTAGPGSSLTREAVAMRRKAEILQYKANNSNMSKKELWSRRIQGFGPNAQKVWATQNVLGSNPNVDNLPRKNDILFCGTLGGSRIKCSPTSSSDVPGPIRTLCYDPVVPLLGYIVQRTYTDNGTKWPQTCWTKGDNGFPVGKAGQ